MLGNIILFVILLSIFFLYCLSLLQRYRYQTYLSMIAEVISGTVIGKKEPNWKAVIFSVASNLVEGTYENKEVICNFLDIIGGGSSSGSSENDSGLIYPIIKMKLNCAFNPNEEAKKILPKNIKIEEKNAYYWIVWKPLFKESIFWFTRKYLTREHINYVLKSLLDLVLRLEIAETRWLKEVK